MPIQNYPRFLTKASKTAQQLQSGLPIVGSDGVTGDFNALKVNTDGSINVAGGGGGDATASNQVLQINEATDSNLFLAAINTNTSTSTGSGIKITDLLESSSGETTANLLEYIWTLTIKIQKYSQWNTYYSKVFYNSSGTNSFTITNAVKIVFNSANIEISGFTDMNGLSILGDYFTTTGTSYLSNQGCEVISNGNSAGDLFQSIEIVGAGHFTVYFLNTPYITP